MTSTAGTPNSIAATTALLEGELPLLEQRQQALEKELAAVSDRADSVRTALSALHALASGSPVQAAAAPTGEPGTEPVTEPVVPSPATEAELATGPKMAPPSDEEPSATTEPEPEPQPGPEPKSEAKEKAPAAPRRARKATARRQQPAAAAPRTRRPATKTTTAKKTTTARSTKATTAKKTAAPVADADNGNLTEQVLGVLTASGDSPVRARDVAKAVGRPDTPGSINTVRSTLDRLVATSRARRAGRGLYQAWTK
ncbi:hypothetical protein [Streptomyces sp. NPDC050856]|uniref:hypothetical protein n=1 Tax=Streptomyces sp. NPDC050856 TaxID=3154939 RepID=UPI0033C6DE24